MQLPVFRRVTAAATLFLAVLSSAGCDRTQSGKTDVIVIGDAPAVVDPAAAHPTEPQAVLLSAVAQGLVRFDAAGQIVPGLAERWNVTDDGLSYIFRLQSAEWPDGRKVTAQQVARLLRRQIASRSKNPLRDTLGAIDQIVPMTDRVIEISLKAPRPHLLQLLAHPQFGIVREQQGTGPFQITKDGEPDGPLILGRTVSSPDEDVVVEEVVTLTGRNVQAAVRAFLKGDADLVLGGTFADLPYSRVEDIPKAALRFDPAGGLFGLVPARADGPAADREIRRLLSESIDRQSLIDALEIPGLLPRATILEPGLDGVPNPTPPPWLATPLDRRRVQLIATAERLFGDLERPTIRVALSDAPGARILLNRLATDWGALGLKVEVAKAGEPADFRLIDAVAPSTSPAWYLRNLRCGLVPVCEPEADELLEAARAATVGAQRNGMLAQAAQRMDEEQLFIAIAAPIRWSLVSDRVQGFATNRFARHTMTSLGQRLDRERAD
jgi:oligopeptide transport system substrate-binding protein